MKSDLLDSIDKLINSNFLTGINKFVDDKGCNYVYCNGVYSFYYYGREFYRSTQRSFSFIALKEEFKKVEEN